MKRLLSQTETATLLGVDRGTVHDLLEDGLLRGWQVNGRWRFVLANSVEALLRAGGVADDPV